MGHSILKCLFSYLLYANIGIDVFAQCIGVTPGMVSGNVVAGSNTVTATNTTGFVVGMPINGAGIPSGTTVASIVNGTTFTMSTNATANGVSVTTHSLVPNANWLPPTVPVTSSSNYPPLGAVWGIPAVPTCSVCPATFTVPICANNYATAYLCQNNQYTFSLCTSASTNDFSLSIVNSTPTFTAVQPGYAGEVFDDDGCGVVNGPSELTFSPEVNAQYRIRILQDPCEFNAALCGTLVITCAEQTIGISEATTNWSLSIQPNPAADQLTVSAPFTGELRWQITDMSGRTVKQGREIALGRITIGIASLAKGTYTLRMVNEDGVPANALFEKQ